MPPVGRAAPLRCPWCQERSIGFEFLPQRAAHGRRPPAGVEPARTRAVLLSRHTPVPGGPGLPQARSAPVAPLPATGAAPPCRLSRCRRSGEDFRPESNRPAPFPRVLRHALIPDSTLRSPGLSRPYRRRDRTPYRLARCLRRGEARPAESNRGAAQGTATVTGERSRHRYAERRGHCLRRDRRGSARANFLKPRTLSRHSRRISARLPPPPGVWDGETVSPSASAGNAETGSVAR